MERGERRERVRLAGEQAQLGADPGPAHRRQRAAAAGVVGERARVRLDGEAKAAGVAGEAQQPRRVIDEAPVVEHAQHACFQVGRQRAGSDANVPGCGPVSAIAPVLTVKSRRFRSSLSSAGSTSGRAPGRA